MPTARDSRVMNLAASTSPRAMPMDKAPVGPTGPGPGPVADDAVPTRAAPVDKPVDNDILPERTAPDAEGSTGWKLWNEGNVTRPIVDSIDGAKQIVNAEFFGFSDGGKGAHVVDALERAAQRGVEVNVMVDAISMTALPLGSFGSMKNRIQDAGGTVKTNVRVPVVWDHDDTPGLKHVDHRKVVTVDGTDAYVGGINFIKIEDDYADSMVQLSGVAAARLAADQLDRWGRVGGAVTPVHTSSMEQALNGAALVPTSPREMRILSNAPEQKKFELSDGYRELIRGAKERLWISSPGFSDQELMGEINQAAQRGVDVRILAPGKPPLGIPVIKWVGQSHLREVVAGGGKAYETPGVLHRKALISDDQVIFSSFNLTGRSKTHDHEIGVQTTDPEFVKAIQDVLERDIAASAALDPTGGSKLGRKFGDLFAQTWKVNY